MNIKLCVSLLESRRVSNLDTIEGNSVGHLLVEQGLVRWIRCSSRGPETILGVSTGLDPFTYGKLLAVALLHGVEGLIELVKVLDLLTENELLLGKISNLLFGRHTCKNVLHISIFTLL